MTVTPIASNFSTTGFAHDVTTDGEYELGKDGYLVSTVSHGLRVAPSLACVLTLDGTTRGNSTGAGSGIFLTSPSSLELTIGATGVAIGDWGLNFQGEANVTNAGMIIGINGFGISSIAGDMILNNSGFIQGAVAAVKFNVSNVTHTIVNSGMIRSTIAITVDSNNSVENITNTGTIDGALYLGGGDDSVQGEDGIINGTVNLGDGFNEFFGGRNNDHAIGGADADLLDGGMGNDTLEGGAGDDNYYVDSQGDIIVEAAGDALDTVLARSSYTLAADVDIEKLLALGSANLDLGGNGIANQLYGNNGNNIITSTDIGDGADDLRGSLGDDTYVLGDVADTINDTGGNDTIRTALNLSLQNYTGVDNIQLTGSANVGASGNGSANSVTGNSGKNLLEGGGGNDILVGGLGADSLFGGNDRDTFDFNTLSESGLNAARDTIFDFASGLDRIDLATIDAITGGLDSAFLLDARGAAGSSIAKGHIGYFWIDKGGVSNDRTVLRMNVDGDATIEMSLALQGLHTMKAGDFAL